MIQIFILQCKLWLEIFKISWNLIHGVNFPMLKTLSAIDFPSLIIHELITIFTINGKFQLRVTDSPKIAHIKYFMPLVSFLLWFFFKIIKQKLSFRDRKRHKMQASIQPCWSQISIFWSLIHFGMLKYFIVCSALWAHSHNAFEWKEFVLEAYWIYEYLDNDIQERVSINIFSYYHNCVITKKCSCSILNNA